MPATRRPKPTPKPRIIAPPTPWYKRVQNWVIAAAALVAGAATLATNLTSIKTSMSELFGGHASPAASSEPAPVHGPEIRIDAPANVSSERPSNPASIAPPSKLEGASKFSK
jgi:hypothetical protein